MNGNDIYVWFTNHFMHLLAPWLYDDEDEEPDGRTEVR